MPPAKAGFRDCPKRYFNACALKGIPEGLRMTAQWAAELRASPVITFDFCALRFDWFLPLRQARDDRKAGYVGGAKRAESTAKPQRDTFQEQ
jgi:hypothetical protein